MKYTIAKLCEQIMPNSFNLEVETLVVPADTSPKSIDILFFRLQENTTIHALKLTGCNVDDNLVETALIPMLRVNNTLRVIQLDHTHITDVGARQLLVAMENRADERKLYITLYESKLSEVMLERFTDTVRSQEDGKKVSNTLDMPQVLNNIATDSTDGTFTLSPHYQLLHYAPMAPLIFPNMITDMVPLGDFQLITKPVSSGHYLKFIPHHLLYCSDGAQEIIAIPNKTNDPITMVMLNATQLAHVSNSRNSVNIVNLETSHIERVLNQSKNIISLNVINDHILATIDSDCSITFWDIKTGRCMWEPGVKAIAMVPLDDDHVVVSFSECQIWNYRNHTIIASFGYTQNQTIRQIVKISQYELLCGTDSGFVSLWNKNSENAWVCSKSVKAHDIAIAQLLMVSPTTFATTNGEKIKLWDLRTLSFLHELKIPGTPRIYKLLSLKNGTILAANHLANSNHGMTSNAYSLFTKGGEIFQWSQTSRSIDSADIIHFLQALESNTSVKTLILDGCPLGPDIEISDIKGPSALCALSNLLLVNQNITSVSLKGTDLLEEHIKETNSNQPLVRLFWSESKYLSLRSFNFSDTKAAMSPSGQHFQNKLDEIFTHNQHSEISASYGCNSINILRKKMRELYQEQEPAQQVDSERQLVNPKEKRVTIRVWKRSVKDAFQKFEPGHVTIQTYGPQGIYASFWPEIYRLESRYYSGAGYLHSLGQDLRAEGCRPDVIEHIHCLNVDAINTAFRRFKHSGCNWSLMGSMGYLNRTEQSTYRNCCGLSYYLLKEGGLLTLLKDGSKAIEAASVKALRSVVKGVVHVGSSIQHTVGNGGYLVKGVGDLVRSDTLSGIGGVMTFFSPAAIPAPVANHVEVDVPVGNLLGDDALFSASTTNEYEDDTNKDSLNAIDFFKPLIPLQFAELISKIKKAESSLYDIRYDEDTFCPDYDFPERGDEDPKRCVFQ